MLWGHATVHHPTTYFGSRARLQAILMRRPAGFPQSALVVLAVLLVHGVAFCAANHSLAEQVPVGAADLLSLCDRCSPEMHPRCARPWLAFLLIAVGRRLHTLRWVFARYDSIGRLGYRRAEKDMLCPGSPRGTDAATPASACGVRARCYQDRPYSLSQTCLTVHPPGPTAPRSLMLRTHGVHGV